MKIKTEPLSMYEYILNEPKAIEIDWLFESHGAAVWLFHNISNEVILFV